MTDLGGAIEVASRPGRGHDVRDLAAGRRAKSPSPAAEADRALPRGNGEIIMIVDDERPLVALAEEIVAQLGYEPVGFGSSRTALDAFRAMPQRFDAVLTDEAMPELIGIELAHGSPARSDPTMPIILMTGYGGAELMRPSRSTSA